MSAISLAPRGLTWSVLRLHRSSLVFFGSCFLAYAAGMLWLYDMGQDALDRGNMGSDSCDTACQNAEMRLTLDFSTYMGSARMVLAYLPLIIAAYAGGALIARELENGTAALAWTQSVSPLRWLAAKLVVPALLIVAGMGTLMLLYSWVVRSGPSFAEWYNGAHFLATGPVGLAYALCALALGALTGLLLRRTLPALGASFGIMLLLLQAGHVYREHLWPTVERTSDKLYFPNLMHGDQWLREISYDAAGRPTENFGDPGAVTFYREWHPASHRWPIQWVETGILLALTAAAVATAFWVLRRRTP
ncbi:hypothetical protein P8605_15160 [Streptomyces sp. T-3]|nr:hypothetical protein [Streptomyces sp. T-3]